MTARHRWLATSLVAAVSVTGLTGCGGSSGNTVDPGMLVAARQEATNFFSLDYRHASADVDKVLALATGTFKSQYAARRTEVVTGVTSKQLIVTAAIPQNGAAVEYF